MSQTLLIVKLLSLHLLWIVDKAIKQFVYQTTEQDFFPALLQINILHYILILTAMTTCPKIRYYFKCLFMVCY